MFDIIKKSINLPEHISNDLGLDIRECGTDTYQIDEERENGGCPACSHFDCFKIFYNEEEPEKAGYKCFSCDIHGSVIDWHAWRKDLSITDAALDLAKIYELNLPRSTPRNPVQELFNLAAAYYENCLWETCNKPNALLGGKTPSEYQLTVRHHSREVLQLMSVGWSDGGLVEYLESIGIDPDLITEGGLRNKSGKGDFLPANVFIYPHTVKRRVSHFTFKDPAKRMAWQLPNKFVLNKHMFANQDSLEGAENIIVVEGENDLISIMDAEDLPERTAVLGTIGSISGAQLNWLRENYGGPSGANILTVFDPDEAGDKYREKFDKFGKYFKSLIQIRPEQGQDIDEILTKGGSLTQVLSTGTRWAGTMAGVAPWDTTTAPAVVPSYTPDPSLEIPGEAPPSIESDEDTITVPGISVIQQAGCYYKVKMNKDDAPSYIKISDFTLKLCNVFIGEDGKRLREVIVVREDGFKSKKVLVNSDVKTSVRAFQVLISDAADAGFKGSEHDLIDMWKIVYTQVPEGLVTITRHVGRNETFHSWIFSNILIHDSGAQIRPDEEGIFWLPGGQTGVRPESLTQIGSGVGGDIPVLDLSMTEEETRETLQLLLTHLSRNLDSVWKALILVGWAKACIYSNWIHPNKEFPFIYFWGTKGEGKTTVLRWIQDFFDMRVSGYTTVPMLGSTVGIGRKVEYYSSLPLMIDEMRSDRETEQHISLFRSYYDRGQRVTATRDSFGIRSQEIRSCFTFVGEDMVEDPAFKERCIPIRVPVNNREMIESYRWIEGHRNHFTGITYQWLKESVQVNRQEVRREMQELEKKMVESGCTKRTSKNWSVAAYFAKQLAEEFFPNYHFEKNLFENAEKETVEQKTDSTVMQFFETIESIQAQERTMLNGNHMQIQTEGNDTLLHMWHPAIYRIVQEQSRNNFPFSKNAVLSMIRDEPWYVGERKVQMGIEGARRTVITLNLSNPFCPETIKNIGTVAGHTSIS